MTADQLISKIRSDLKEARVQVAECWRVLMKSQIKGTPQ